VIEHVQPNQLPQNSFDSFFDAETATALNKPWLNLERGARLQRFRVFADEYPGLNEDERANLNKVLGKANDAKMLNTKQLPVGTQRVSLLAKPVARVSPA
jgi:hypothetical protein